MSLASRRALFPLIVPASFALLLACKHEDSSSPVTGADAATDVPEDVPPRPRSPAVSPVLVGTGGFGYGVGSAFPGAVAPNGLAKIGPDTKGPWGTINFLHESGYWYGDDTIQGFSHLHLHGTGASDYGVLGVMPLASGEPLDVAHTTPAGYESKFAKASESAIPGKYAVTLDRGQIGVELTATPHAGHHRFTWPKGATDGRVLFDLDHHLSGGAISAAEVTLHPAEKRVRGLLHSLGGMSRGFGGYDVYFEIRAARAWKSSSVWSGGGGPAAGTTASGAGVGFTLEFDLAADASPVETQIGLSFVSGDAAAQNLTAEMPAFAFDTTAKKTAADWQSRLDLVKVTGGNDDQRTMLTAALYHCFLMPTVTSDVDGSYRGVDGAVHLASGFQYVTDMSLWDTYRTLHPFYSLVAPDRARDSARSLVEMAKARGSFPRWPIATGEAGTMIGASADVVLADAALKHVAGFDPAEAYPLLRAAALDATAPPGGRGGRDDADVYMKLGYVPASHGGSVSRTLEYAQDDYALAQLATFLGKADDAKVLLERSRGWRQLFDPSSGYLWPKAEDGSFPGDHSSPSNFTDAFVEANAEQTLWGAPHDHDGLITLLGGKAGFVTRLQDFMEKGKADYDALDPSDTLASAGMRPYFWAGNEPDIHAPWLFSLAGRPDLTQKWLRWVLNERFGSGADGIPGNDDGGTMSAYWLFGAIGLYPIVGSDRYLVAAPLFPHVEVAVNGGTFTVDATGLADDSFYVQSATLDGAPLTQPMLTHAQIKAGSKLAFVIGKSPSDWGK